MVEINVENGTERQITQRKFYVISGISWLPNKNGLIFTASEDFSLPQKIWKLAYKTGEVEQLVNDAGSYSKISLDKEAKQMIVSQVSSDFSLFVADFVNPKDLKSLSSAFDKPEFISGDRIIYPNFMNGQGDIWMMNSDGSAQKQLTNDPASDARIIISPDERFIFFTSNRTGSHQIWRMNFDGSNQKQITTKEGGFPILVTSDGNTVFYWSSFNRNLWKIPSDGGEETLVLDKKMHQPSISTDGKYLSYLFREANSHKIAVVLLEDLQTKYTFSPLNSDSNLVCLKWANDNQSLYYVTLDKDKNYRLWQQSLLAQKPSEITNFGDAEITDFSISRDNKKFAVIRGEWKHNTVLIKASK